MDPDLQILFTFNYFNMLQNYCNVSQTYTTCCRVGYLLLKHLTVPFNCAAFSSKLFNIICNRKTFIRLDL